MIAMRKIFRWLSCLFAILGVITVLVISTPIVSWWVQSYAGPIEQPKGDVLILLSAARDDATGISYSSFWRARAATIAWKSGGFKKIVVSGGGAGLFNFLVAEGIPREAITIESRSTSTRENALEAARLLQSMPGKKVLLTSDFHMYRAQRVFRKAGIDAAPLVASDLLNATEHWNGSSRPSRPC